MSVLLIFYLKHSQSNIFLFFLFFFILRKMQGMSNYVLGSCMSEHNMQTMKIECMQLAEQKHAK